jgi:hypothetical protein
MFIEETFMRQGEILTAWLQELANAQPEFGPLLQSTVDRVGALSAAGDGGVIYAVSHRRYRFAARASETGVTRLIGTIRNRAIVAGEEARDAKDEPTMIQNEDKVRFWTDVLDWVESAGAARMHPDPVPDWITRLNLEFAS